MRWFHENVLMAWILSFAAAVCVVKGDYLFVVTTHGFNNSGSLLSNGACCDHDEGGSCAVPGCDSFFRYCLRRSRNGLDEHCRTSQTNFDDGHLDFSESTFLSLPNPLPLQGLTRNWNGIWFHLIVTEADGQTNGGIVGEVLDFFRLPVGVQTRLMTYQYPDPMRAMVTLSFRAECAENYYGADCSQLCVCSNGQCVNEFNSFTCSCDPGFTGAECEDNINECIDPGMNCSGNGQCVDEFGSYSCNCSAGYNGTDCEINIDDCSPNPCGANGQCIDGVNSFTCNCAAGYAGQLCDTDIDECLSDPCGMNHQCENQEGSFNCSCARGFTGDLCQTNINDCVGVNCSGNGVCLDGVNSFTCQCSPGHGGTLCADEIRSSGVQAGPIVGGVLGVISLTLILIIVIAVVLTVRCLNRQGKENIQGRTVYSDTLPGDNPVYDRGNTAVTLGGLTQASAPVHYVNLSSSDRDKTAGSAPDRVFDNPIYGGNDEEMENTYADPDANHHAGTGMGSAPYHKFDNPIYGGEADENAYSLLANSSTENAYSSLADSSTGKGTAASTGQALYTNSKIGTHHWQ